MKKLLLSCLVALSLAATGCADFAQYQIQVQTQNLSGRPSPTDAGVLVEQATATPSYQGRIDLNRVTAAVSTAFATGGQALVADLASSDYVVTPTVTKLYDLFDNCITMNLKVTSRSTQNIVYSADFDGISLTQEDSLAMITAAIVESFPKLLASINADHEGPSQMAQSALLLNTPSGDARSKKMARRVPAQVPSPETTLQPAPGRFSQPAQAQQAPADSLPAVPQEVADATPAQAVPDPGGIAFGRYHALVIGIDNYRSLPKLKTAVRDAQDVAEVLKKDYGFSVQLLRDATRAQIVDALSRLRQAMTGRDNLLIYYAGHGWLDADADEGYWLPVDATRDSEVNWVSNAFVTGSLKALQAKHVLVVADSCYSGKLSRGLNITRLTPDYLSRMAAKRARQVLSSGGLEPVADSGGGGHSVFARAFLNELSANTGVLDGTSLFTRLRRPVMLDSDQTPEYADVRKAGHEGGDFLFVRRK